MGFSFGAGTTDGPGAPFFFQGDLEGNEMWREIGHTLHPPSEEDIQCHAPKPILLMTGRMTTPYLWQPRSLPTQIITIGDAVILGVPAEMTTMVGRRLRADIEAIGKIFGKDAVVLPTGLANIYSSYITTWEEYQVQRYEAGSTTYGPHALTIIQQQFAKLYSSLLIDLPLPPGPEPIDESGQQLSFLLPPTPDVAGPGGFGACIVQPDNNYRRGEEVFTTFVSGNPRNNLNTESSYFFVERLQSNGQWEVIATDANWETRFYWRSLSGVGRSEIDFYWDIPENVENGEYRVRHAGSSRGLLTGVRPYTGSSRPFLIVT